MAMLSQFLRIPRNFEIVRICLDQVRGMTEGRNFADIFKCIFLNENWCIFIKISLNFKYEYW